MVDFINEVEEELRKDKYNELLRKYGPMILGVIIAIVAVAGYIEWDKASSDRKARATSAAYVDASNLESEGNLEGALRNFLAISEKAPAGYSGLSLMRAASLQLELGERTLAVSSFDAAAEKFETPRHKQLAQIKAAYILANDGEFEAVLSRVEPLAQKDTPYEFLARELKGFAAQQSGDLSKARQEFSYLSSIPGVPETIKSRADQSLSLMRVDASLKDAPQDDLDATILTPELNVVDNDSDQSNKSVTTEEEQDNE